MDDISDIKAHYEHSAEDEDERLVRHQLEYEPDSEQLLHVLAALSKGGWGRRNLVRILHGEAGLPDRARSVPAFGALTYRSGAEIDRLVDRLIIAGCIEENELSHGGIALGLTDGGWRAVREGGCLRRSEGNNSVTLKFRRRQQAVTPLRISA